MKKLITVSLFLVLASGAYAAPKSKSKSACKNIVSCEGVDGAKREGFCWRKKSTLKDSKKEKICKTKYRAKKKMKRKSSQKV